MKHCSWHRYQELRMPPGRCGGGSSPRGLSNTSPGHLKPWVQSSTPSRLATEKRNFSASDYDDARPAKLWNLCRRLAMTKISHLSFNAFTHLAQARVCDSDSSLLPKPCTLRAFVLLCWPQMNSAHWRTAVIPSMLNVPSAKISQVGWVWGQLFPEGTPTREFPFPLQKKSNIALNQPHRCYCTYMEPTDSVTLITTNNILGFRHQHGVFVSMGTWYQLTLFAPVGMCPHSQYTWTLDLSPLFKVPSLGGPYPSRILFPTSRLYFFLLYTQKRC